MHGPERARLEKLAEDLGVAEECDFLGWQANPFAFMSKANLFVLSSRWEGSPNVVVEAMACGCPVVATDCGSGPAEILKVSRESLVPVGNPDELAEAILAGLDCSNDGRGAATNLEAYSVTSSAREYLRILRQQTGFQG